MKQILIAVDQLVNTLVWIKGDGFGFADETLSARAWRLRCQSSAYKRIDALFFWDRDGGKHHCELSYESELERRHLPRGYSR